jgi:TonB family protein
MSARALLLSPDDQAVSAITGVLEEMSVLCERPRDGATAAQKLNSQSYDLVLVDCDNLPAAKLIFDVCRRANAGTTIPIAIVDGRAGLPTAFRLGAELILTKPVAKDQARTTIRTAVSRLRKEAHATDAPPFEAPAPSISEPTALAAAASASASAPAMMSSPPAETKPPVEIPPTVASVVPEEPQAVPEPPQLATQVVVPPVMPSASIAEIAPQPKKAVPAIHSFENAAFKPIPNPPEEAVREELSNAETELHTPITFSSFDHSKKRPKRQGLLVALIILGMASAGFYAAWTTQPEFRAMVKPQLDKAIDSAYRLYAGKKAVPAQSVQPATTAPAQKATATPSAPAPQSDATAAIPTNPAPDKASPTTTDSASVAPETSQAKATTDAKSATADDADKAPEESSEKPAKSASAPADSALPWEKDAVILSSKGAEKRLVHHVKPSFPKGSHAQKADGTVVLKTLVGGDGAVQGVRLVEGNPALATAATKAVKQWRYKPYMRNGARTSFQTIVIVDFQQP